MPAPLTVVIPTLNAAETLGDAAASLIAGVQGGLIGRLVVSDGGSTDATHAVAEALGAVIVTGAAGRGGQIARGIAAVPGGFVLVLHADTHLSGEWVTAIERHMHDHPTDGGYFRLAFRAEGLAPRCVAGWANLRARLFGLPYGDQGLLVSVDVLATLGGYPELPLMEDVAMARALRGRLRMLDAVARTDAGKYRAQGWLRRGGRNLWTLGRYLCGADPARLAASYRRR
ncbi:glycosyltransferase [Oceaniglobus indicus]|uniref:glycosyltransferase n=1 Tax=Oceaniglobus indicus TaxID=2047749 RepID=UPI000C192F76|nr:glycosyltransferase [Oceaniglobus indicus]